MSAWKRHSVTLHGFQGGERERERERERGRERNKGRIRACFHTTYNDVMYPQQGEGVLRTFRVSRNATVIGGLLAAWLECRSKTRSERTENDPAWKLFLFLSLFPPLKSLVSCRSEFEGRLEKKKRRFNKPPGKYFSRRNVSSNFVWLGELDS